MVSLIHFAVWGLMLLTSVVFIAVGFRTNRHQRFPGASSFSRYTALLGLFFILLIANRLLSTVLRNPSELPNWLVIIGLISVLALLVLALLLPISWVRFVLIYTGQQVPTTVRTFVIIGLPAIVGIAGLASLYIIGIGGELLGIARIGNLPLGAVFEYILAFTVFYVAALLVAGAMLVGWTNYTYRHLSTRGGVLLGVGAILPWAAVTIPLVGGFFEVQSLIYGIHAGVGGVIGAAAVGGAVTRYRIFETIPTAGTVGRDVTVENMTDPVVVLDENQLIIDLNPAADELLDTTYEAIGRPLTDYIQDEQSVLALLENEGGNYEFEFGQRIVEATPSALEDAQGRTIGYSIVFHDITERKRREQRIQVLNRVLRHNLRNDLNAVNGYAELLEQEATDTKGYAIQIQEVATELISIGEKAREIEAVVSGQQESRSASLGPVIEEAVEEVREVRPDCRISVSVQTDGVPVNGAVLTSVVRELVDNACRHNDANDPQVEVETTSTDDEYPLCIRVKDNGPGVPEQELTPLRKGTETALEHGSGLGLWLIDWGVATLGGKIEYGANEPRGTVATLRLPSHR